MTTKPIPLHPGQVWVDSKRKSNYVYHIISVGQDACELGWKSTATGDWLTNKFNHTTSLVFGNPTSYVLQGDSSENCL